MNSDKPLSYDELRAQSTKRKHQNHALMSELTKLKASYAKTILALKQIYDDGITRDRPCEIAENTLYELGEL